MSFQVEDKDWLNRKNRKRAKRALARQLSYQEEKAGSLEAKESDNLLNIFMRARTVRQRLEAIDPIPETAKVLEVGSGAHGLIFGFGAGIGVGVDPLAVDYKRLFPKWQENAGTVAAIGEELPFEDGAFDVVLSDNVVDHAEGPVKIIEELVRVLRPGGLLYFTVNIHHPVYDLASRAHGFWNSVGIKFELSPFADHTVHFTEAQIRSIFARLPVEMLAAGSTIDQVKSEYAKLRDGNMEQRLKKIFFKNALIEIIAKRR